VPFLSKENVNAVVDASVLRDGDLGCSPDARCLLSLGMAPRSATCPQPPRCASICQTKLTPFFNSLDQMPPFTKFVQNACWCLQILRLHNHTLSTTPAFRILARDASAALPRLPG
jgi:hypothetical protein